MRGAAPLCASWLVFFAAAIVGLTRAHAAVPADLQLQLPLPCGNTAYIYCGYDAYGATYGYCPYHTGSDRYALDFTYAFSSYSPDHGLGEPVTAVAGGRVAAAGTYGGYGLAVLVEHQTSAGVYNSLYAHLQAISVTEGQPVAIGEEVGKLGRSGNANGIAHLHFVLRKGGGVSDGEAAIPEPMSGHTGLTPEVDYPVSCAAPPPPPPADTGVSPDAHPTVPADAGPAVAEADARSTPDLYPLELPADRSELRGGCGVNRAARLPRAWPWLGLLCAVALARRRRSR